MAARKGATKNQRTVEATAPERELHRSHKDVISRMNRAAGQIRNIVAMIEGHRSCLDIAQQMHAVEMAVSAAKKALIKDHIDHCLEAATEEGGPRRRAAIDEFKEITKYL